MKVRVPHYYDLFSCTGSKCPDTCCVGWMIEIDDESYERFMKMEGEYGEKIRANIIERPDGRFFGLNENGRCIFLNENNLCDMVINLGEDSLCSLCDNYPRVGVEFGDLREMGLSISCPEVAKLMLSSSKPIRFGEWNLDEEVTGTDYTKDPVFLSLMDSRDVLFGIVQNRERTIGARLALYVMFASGLQNVLDNGEDIIAGIEKLNEKYSDEAYLEKAVKSIKRADFGETRKFMQDVLGFIDSLETINDKWKKIADRTGELYKMSVEEYVGIHQEFEDFYADRQYEYEHLMIYYVYRYFMKMIFDGDIYSKAVMCAVTTMLTKEMDVAAWYDAGKNFDVGEQIKIMYLYSKEIEHCEENMEALADEFWDDDKYQPQSLINNMTNIL